MAHLSIGTSASRINLLDPGGFLLREWRPQAGGIDATFQESALADYRRPVSYRDITTIETFGLVLKHTDQDEVIKATQDLRKLLRTAIDYWTTKWENDVVYVKAQASCETNTRYAVVYDGRLPQDDQPYAQPFFSSQPVMRDLALIVERGPWLDNVPGTGTCVEISGKQGSCYPAALWCDGDTQAVDCGSNAILDNIPDFAVAGRGQLTAEAWILASSYGEGDAGRIFAKTGWHFRVGATHGLRGYVACVAQDAFSEVGLDDFTADGQWHHVLMTYDETGAGTPAARTIYIAVDGVWAATYDNQQVSVGNYLQDHAQNLLLGNNQALTAGFHGMLGWCWLFDFIRHNPAAGNFTPDVRCQMKVKATSLGQWIKEGQGTAIDNWEGTAAVDGTAANNTWSCSCEGFTCDGCDTSGFGRDDTCEDEVYVANKHNEAQLTHAFHYDASGPSWSDNIINDSLPVDLLPAVPAVGDIIYFGIDTTARDSGPFCSLVFDLSTMQRSLTMQWEYWDTGTGWTVFTPQDNTNADGLGTGQPFDTKGVKSVHWLPDVNWVTTTVHLVTGYWVRCLVTGIAPGVLSPTQQNRNIYTILWPYIDVPAQGGDIPPFARIKIRAQTNWHDTTVILGSRRVSRGSSFSAYINAAQEQNALGITVTAPWAGATFTADVQTPTGRKIAVVAPIGNEVMKVVIAPEYSSEYTGVYRVFARVDADTADVIQLELNAEVGGPVSTVIALTDKVYVETTVIRTLVDLGKISIPPAESVGDNSYELDLKLYAYGNGVADIDIFELIIFPIDEWTSEVGRDALIFGHRSSILGSYLDVDSITFPKAELRSLVLASDDDNFLGIAPVFGGSTYIVFQKEASKMWMLFTQSGSNKGKSDFYVGFSIQAWAQKRYLSMRGAG